MLVGEKKTVEISIEFKIVDLDLQNLVSEIWTIFVHRGDNSRNFLQDKYLFGVKLSC